MREPAPLSDNMLEIIEQRQRRRAQFGVRSGETHDALRLLADLRRCRAALAAISLLADEYPGEPFASILTTARAALPLDEQRPSTIRLLQQEAGDA